MWKANIKNIEADASAKVALVTIEYASDTKTETVVERVSEPTSLIRIAKDGVRERERQDAIADLIANPPLGEINLDPPVLTQEQLDEQGYQQKKQELLNLKTDLDLGLVDQTVYDQTLNDALSLKSTLAVSKIVI